MFSFLNKTLYDVHLIEPAVDGSVMHSMTVIARTEAQALRIAKKNFPIDGHWNVSDFGDTHLLDQKELKVGTYNYCGAQITPDGPFA